MKLTKDHIIEGTIVTKGAEVEIVSSSRNINKVKERRVIDSTILEEMIEDRGIRTISFNTETKPSISMYDIPYIGEVIKGRGMFIRIGQTPSDRIAIKWSEVSSIDWGSSDELVISFSTSPMSIYLQMKDF